MKNILITGGSGQLGHCLIEEIEKRYKDIIHYDAPSHNEFDIRNEFQIDRYLNNKKYDYLINCAAYTDVPGCESCEEISLLSNAFGPKVLANKCAEYNIKLIHISTDYVYNGSLNIITEDSSTNPLNRYGRHKLLGEQEIQSVENLKYIILRISWLYSEYGKNFYNTIVSKIKNNENIKVVNDQVGSPTNAHDLARFIIEIINNDTFTEGIYHYSNEGTISWYDFANAIYFLYKDMQKEYNKDINITLDACKTSDYLSSVVRPTICILSKDKVKKIFGKKYIINWLDSLKTFMYTNIKNEYIK